MNESNGKAKQISLLLIDLRQNAISGEGRGVVVADTGLLLASIDEIIHKVEGADEWSAVGDVLFNRTEGIFRFVDLVVKIKTASLASTRADTMSTTDGGLKSAIDLVTYFISTSRSTQHNTYITLQCGELLRRTTAIRGISLFQEALFGPLTYTIENCIDLSISAGDIGVVELLDTLLKITTQSSSRKASLFSQRVRRCSLATLGLITKIFPAECSLRSPDITISFKQTLEHIVKSESPEFTVAAGLLDGITNFLHNFSNTEDHNWIETLYKFMIRGMELIDHTRYDLPKAALRLLKNHAKLFRKLLLKDRMIFGLLRALVSHRNDYLRKAAIPAVGPYAGTLAVEIVNNKTSDERSRLSIFKNVYSNASELTIQGGQGHKVSLGVLTMGYLSPAAVFFNGSEAGHNILSVLLSKFINMFTSIDDELIGDSIRLIPSYIDAISAAVSSTSSTLPSLLEQNLSECIRIVWIHYPRPYTFTSTRVKIHTTLVRLLLAIYNSTDGLQRILRSVMFSIVSLTISGTESIPVEYNKLWNSICSISAATVWDYPWDNILGSVSTGHHLHMTSIVVDSVATTVMQLVSRLDLSFHKDSTDDVPLARNPKDFTLFHNVVAFWNKLFEKVRDPGIINDWCLSLAVKWIELSEVYPHVSGFYSLLTIVVRKATTIEEEAPATQPANNTNDPEFNQIIRKFIADTLKNVESRFKGEILIAGCKFLLSLPVQLVELPKMKSTLEISLNIGLSLPTIARITIDTLERWIESSNAEEAAKLVAPSIPILRSFVATAHEKLHTDGGESSHDNEVSILRDLQVRIIIILGKLGPLQLTSKSEEKKLDDGIEPPWDVVSRVEIKLPFDANYTLAFDKLLPRICTLSLTSNDRKAKTASCELLHSIIIWMVGTNAHSLKTTSATQDSPVETATPFHKIYSKVFPVVCQLAVDSEPIASQMFTKLLQQLVHWLTKNVHFESKETIALLDTLIDGISSSNVGLRDICASNCGEFAKYSIKHGKGTGARNLLSLTTRLHNLMIHPNSSTRYGAAVAWKCVLPELMNDKKLSSIHLMHAVYTAMLSLSMFDEGGVVITHVMLLRTGERYVKRISESLIENDSSRHTLPPACHSLSNLTAWMFDQCFLEEKPARRMAMKLFITFSSLFGVSSRVWLREQYVKDRQPLEESLHMIEHRMTSQPQGLSTVTAQETTWYSVWIREVDTISDTLNWLFENDFVDGPRLLGVGGSSSPHKRRKQQHGDDVGFTAKLKLPKQAGLCMNIMSDVLDSGKGESTLSCTRSTVESILRLVTTVANTLPSAVNVFVNELPHAIKVAVELLLHPMSLGYDGHSVKTQTGVPSLAKKFLQSVVLADQKNTLPKLVAACRDVYSKSDFNIFSEKAMERFLDDKSELCHTSWIYLVRGARALVQLGSVISEEKLSNHLLPKIVSSISGFSEMKTNQKIAIQIAGALESMSTNKVSRPKHRIVIREIWKLCFDLGIPSPVIVNMMSSIERVSRDSLSANRIAKSISNMQSAVLIQTSSSITTNKPKKNDPLPQKGEIFYTNYRTELCEYVLKNSKFIIPLLADKRLTSVIIDVLSLSLAGDNNNVDVVKATVDSVLPYIFEICTETDSTVSTTISIIEKLLELKLLSMDSLLHNSNTLSAIIKFLHHVINVKGLLRAPTPKLKASCRCVSVLIPFLISDGSEEIKETSINMIKELISNELPIHHGEIFSSETLVSSYTMVVEALLDCLLSSKSPELLSELLPLVRGTGTHPLAVTIGGVLQQFFNQLSEVKTFRCAEVCVENFLNEELPADVRYAATSRICLLALQRLSPSECESFFEKYVVSLYKIISSSWPTDVEDCYQSLLSKTSAFTLLDLMYRMCDPSKTRTTINKSFTLYLRGESASPNSQQQYSGKEMNDKIIRASHSALTSVMSFQNDLTHITRSGISGDSALLKYRQAAYSCLVSSLITTQTNLAMITKALFIPRKGEYIWEHVLDLNASHSFAVETSFLLTRNAVQGLRNEWESEDGTSSRQVEQLRYLATQYLSDSSLADLAARPDAPLLGGDKKEVIENEKTEKPNTSESKPEHKPQEESPEGVGTNKLVLSTTQVGSDQDAEIDLWSQLPLQMIKTDGDLEMDSLNRIPITSSVLRLLIFLFNYQQPDQRDPPTWMIELHTKIIDPSISCNIRFFIVKSIINAAHVFMQFAQMWVVPLIDAAVESLQVEGQVTGINYFARDIVLLLISWSGQLQATNNGIMSFELESKCSTLLEMLLKNCAHEQTRVLRSNLELIKAYIEHFKDKLQVGPAHRRIIMGWVSTPFPKTGTKSKIWVKKRITGMQLFGVLAANKIKHYDPVADLSICTEDEFYGRICNSLPPSQRTIPRELIECCSELCGMMIHQLSVLSPVGGNTSEVLLNIVSRRLRSLQADTYTEQFVLVLSGVVKHFPSAADAFLPNALIRIIPHAKGVYRNMVLEIILSRAEHFTGIYPTIHPYVIELLLTGDSTGRSLLLRILQKSLQCATDGDLLHFVTTISGSIKSRVLPMGCLSIEGRSELYQTWIRIYDSKWSNLSEEGKKHLGEHLLNGLRDESLFIREKLIAFWDGGNRLPESSPLRMQRLLVPSSQALTLFSPYLGDQWLQYSSVLMLFLSKCNTEFDNIKHFFSDPLQKCDYNEVLFDTSMEHREEYSTTPLFASQLGLDGSLSQSSAAPAGMIAATPLPIGTLAGSQVSQSQTATTFSHYAPKKSDESLSQTAMLFTPFDDKIRKNVPIGNRSGAETTMPAPTHTMTQYFKRRFRHSNEVHRTTKHAVNATQKVAARERQDIKRRKTSTSIKMWRTYRDGEVPDISISPSSILKPLQALCLYDINCARLVMSEVLGKVYLSLSPIKPTGSGAVGSGLPDGGEPDSTTSEKLFAQSLMGQIGSPNPHEVNKLKIQLSTSLVDMLHSMRHHVAVQLFVHSFIIDYFSDEQIGIISPDVLYLSGLHSQNHKTALLLLEKGLMYRQSRIESIRKDLWRRGKREEIPSSLEVDEDISLEQSENSAFGSSNQSDLKRLTAMNTTAWKYIARSYETLKNRDAASLVIQNKLLSGEAADAISCVINEQFDTALNAIKKAKSATGITQLENELLTTEYRSCLRSLLKWSALNDTCDRTTRLDDPDLWNEGDVSNFVLDHLQSKLLLSSTSSLLSSYNDCFVTSILSTEQLLPICLSHIIEGDITAAKETLMTSLETVLNSWKVSHSNEYGSLLATLQPLVEIYEYITIVSTGLDQPVMTQKCNSLLRKWWYRGSQFDGGPTQWDMYVATRRILSNRIVLHHGVSNLIRNDSNSGSTPPYQDPPHHSAVLLLRAAQAMEGLGSIGPARSFLHSYASTRQIVTSDPNNLDITFVSVAVRNSISRAETAATTSRERARKMYIKTLQYISTEDKNRNTSSTYPILHSFISAETNRGYAKYEDDNTEIIKQALSHYKKALQYDRDPLDSVSPSKGKVITSLVLYADELLQTNSVPIGVDTESLAVLTVKLYLEGIELSDESSLMTCRSHIPRVIELCQVYPKAKDVLYEHIDTIDSWMFLPWTNQLISYIKGPAGDVILKLLVLLLKRFPQQVFYAVSSSSLDLDRICAESDIAAVRVQELRSQLQLHVSPALLRLVNEMEKLHNPDLRFKYWIDELQNTMREYKLRLVSSATTQHRLTAQWKSMATDLFTGGGGTSLNAKFADRCCCKKKTGIKITSPRGEQVSLYEDVESAMKPLIRDLENSFDYEGFQKRCRSWAAAIKSGWSHARVVGNNPLAMFSPFLSEYRDSAFDTDGELVLLPQQSFLSLHSRLPNKLPDICSFNSNVLVMNSIQKPKKLIVNCSDESEHPYLVKGGEDLRQDQRIQQLFYLFNYCMNRDRNCNERNLRIRGYSVVPLTPRVGLVEWVDNCTPLKSMIESRMPSNIHGIQSHPASRKHMEFITEMGKTGDWATGFRVLYGEHGRSDLTSKYQELVDSTDKGFLKRSLASLCATHAAFYDAKQRFCSSYSAASIGQWLLGIGDRHLDNFLIDSNVLEVVPIDFGHAFGTATEVLHIPELMPFRLTPQITHICEPLGASVLKGSMTACLQALNNNNKLLLDVLSVFVREPLATWQRNATRKARKSNLQLSEDQEKPHDEYSAAKISAVQKKLNLTNPWIISAADLAANSTALATTLRHKNGLVNAKGILKGRPDKNYRATVPDTCRSVSEQVGCLIDMASDPNILCRTYMGWAPLF